MKLSNLASGLPRSGRIASWAFAFAAVYAGNSYFSDSKQPQGITFTKAERDAWNEKKKNGLAKALKKN